MNRLSTPTTDRKRPFLRQRENNSAAEGLIGVTQIKRHILILLLAAATLEVGMSAKGQGTVFSYQGALSAGGTPANGGFDMTFKLFDAITNGNHIGVTITNNATGVTNGLFSVSLDFGSGIFTGASYWLEIGVRTNGSNAFTILAPRQELTPTPYAIYSPTAGTATSATIAANATVAATSTNFSGGLAGDVTGAQNVTVVSKVGGQPAANVAAGAGAANSATSANTSGTIVKRDASGNFTAGTITANLSGTAATATNFSGSLAGDVTGGQNATVVSSVGGLASASVAAGASAANIATSANSSSAIVKRDASGNFLAGTITANLMGNAATASTATNFSQPLAGDVTGGQNATVVSSIAGQSAANVASGVIAANAATSANTANAIVRRDSVGGFSAGALTATSFTGNGSGLTRMNGANLIGGSVGTNQLAPGTAIANLQASGQLGVPGGGIVLSTQSTATNLINAGYTQLGNVLTAENWASGSAINEPGARNLVVAIWTGSQVIVWGGLNGAALGTGGLFDPLANSWTPLPTNNAPSPRYYFATVWTGAEMIIWGGRDGSGGLNTGGRYNPTSDSWTTMSTNGAPSPRDELYDAVWTGTEMIVWGGYDYTLGDAVATGARYNPATDTWTGISTNGAPHASYDHAAVWSGSEMLIWGGGYGSSTTTTLNTGARYNPATDTWVPINTTNAPSARFIPYYVWTGTEMIVWGGRTNGFSGTGDGGRYNPATDTWTTMTTTRAPSARSDYPPRAVWTGSEMLVWGGTPTSGGAANDGGRYDPVGDAWRGITTLSAPSARANFAMAWTGNAMIIFGGFDNSATLFGDLSIYTPPRSLYLYLKP